MSKSSSAKELILKKEKKNIVIISIAYSVLYDSCIIFIYYVENADSVYIDYIER